MLDKMSQWIPAFLAALLSQTTLPGGQVSDRPAQAPRIVLLVASHDSISVRFFYLTSVSLRDLSLLHDIIGGSK